MKLVYCLLSIAVVITFCDQTRASEMSAIEIFNRCYIRMTRQIPDESSQLYLSVESGAKSAEAACMEIYDLASLSADGIMVNRTDAVSKRVLKTFNDLHISWFQSKVYATTIVGGSLLVRDIEEPALYFTRAAFLSRAKFHSIVTLNQGLQGVRDQISYPVEINNFESQRVLRYGATMPYAMEKDLIISYDNILYNPTRNRYTTSGVLPTRLAGEQTVETGALVGIKPAALVRIPSNVPFPSISPEVVTSLKSLSADFNLNKHFGSGIIGSQTFLMANQNLSNREFPDKLTSINRRISSRVFQDVMCHQMPSLSDADVKSEVDSSSPYMFQQQSTCMRCHSSIDGMALSMRNLIHFSSSANASSRQTTGVPISGLVQMPVVTGASTFALQPITQTPYIASLHYRELLSSKVIKTPLVSINHIGTEIAKTNDIYLCAAKRYYKFFTGVDVMLHQKATETNEKYHQDTVIRLSATLKSKQSVRELINEIFKSETFRTRNYLAEKIQ